MRGPTTVLLSLIAASAALAGPPPELEPYAFLVGEWTATGSGQPGVGTGTATFTRTLQDHALVRTSFAEYPAASGRPATRHDDLMVLYAQSGAVHADYYDSEGHVIRYAVSSDAPGHAVFVSEAAPGQPVFRLTYQRAGDVLRGEFAIAPPAPRRTFEPYLTWESTRVVAGP